MEVGDDGVDDGDGESKKYYTSIIYDHHHCIRPQLSSGQQMFGITHRTKQYILSSTINITLLLFMITIIAFAPSYPRANKCPTQ